MTPGGRDRRRRAIRSLPAFLLRVLTDFRRNQGLLLSGAVAYYTLLSIVPLFLLMLVGLSHVVDEQPLLDTVLEMAAVIVLLGAHLIAVIDRERGRVPGPDLEPRGRPADDPRG